MKVLHAFNQHRGGGGANNATRATIEHLRRSGAVEISVFSRSSREIENGLLGKLRAGASVFYARDSVVNFVRHLDAFEPDIVHVHELFPLVSPWILPECTRRGVPVVMSLLDYRLTCPVVTHQSGGELCSRCVGGREYHAVLRNCRGSLGESATMALYSAMVRKLGLFTKHVDRFIAPSEFTRNWFVEHGGVDPNTIRAVAPIVDIPDHAVDVARGDYVAFAGRFAPIKGIACLVEAAERAGLPLRLARNAESFVSIDVPSSAQVVVTSTPEELAAFYRGARIVVVPSLWFETFGLVGAEAMSHGVPVIASRIGAVDELVEDGVDGLCFTPGDSVELGEKLQQLWADEALRRRLGRAAREKAIRHWSARPHVAAMRSVYHDVLNRRVPLDGARSEDNVLVAKL